MSKYYIPLDELGEFLAHLEDHYNAENGFNLKEQIIVKSVLDEVIEVSMNLSQKGVLNGKK